MPEATLEGDVLLHQQATNEFQTFVGTAAPFFERHPGGRELIGVPPDRNPEPESATGKHVQRRDFLREDHWMSEG